MWQAAYVILVLGSAALLGGLVRWVRSASQSEEPLSCRTFLRFFLTSLAAVFLVPLFLSFTRSEVLNNALSPNKGTSLPENLFLLFAIALAASLGAERFISSVSQRLLQDIQRHDQEIKAIQKDMAQHERYIQMLKEPEIGPPTPRVGGTVGIAAVQPEEAKPLEKDVCQVLEALVSGPYRLRSLSGLAVDTELPPERVREILERLKAGGEVMEVATDEGPRWAITAQGYRMLRARRGLFPSGD